MSTPAAYACPESPVLPTVMHWQQSPAKVGIRAPVWVGKACLICRCSNPVTKFSQTGTNKCCVSCFVVLFVGRNRHRTSFWIQVGKHKLSFPPTRYHFRRVHRPRACQLTPSSDVPRHLEKAPQERAQVSQTEETACLLLRAGP